MKTSTSEFSPSLHPPRFGRVAEAKTVSITVTNVQRLPFQQRNLGGWNILCYAEQKPK